MRAAHPWVISYGIPLDRPTIPARSTPSHYLFIENVWILRY
jgi:hypothetical protein